jgi:hypothetical protein
MTVIFDRMDRIERIEEVIGFERNECIALWA